MNNTASHKRQVAKNRQMVILTIFAMLLVIIGHSDITDDFKDLWIYKWVFTFHMPLFFFISGFLFCLTNPPERMNKTSFGSFMKKKTIRLLLPFLFINTIIFIVKSCYIQDKSMIQHPVEFTWDSFLYSTFFSPLGFMWFLPCLFTVFLIAYPIWKIVKEKFKAQTNYILLTMSGLIVVFYVLSLFKSTKFMQFSPALFYLCFFFLGICYCEYKRQVDSVLKKYWILLVLIFVPLSVFMVFDGAAGAVMGVLGSLVIALIIEDKCPDKLVKLSDLCYTVFLLSYFPQMFIRGPIAHRFPELNQYMLSTVSFVTGLIIPVLVGLVLLALKKRHKLWGKLAILVGV